MKNIINFILKKLNVFILYRFGDAIGDQLCMTAVIEALAKNKKIKIIVISKFSELFYNNPYVYINISFHNKNELIQRILKKLLFNIKGEQVENFLFESDKYECLEDYMRETKSKESLIEAHSRHFKNKLDLKNTKPTLYFSDEELKIYDKKFKNLPKDFAVIQPIGKTTYTPNKEWGFEKFQDVINNVDINWLQTGLKGDKILLNSLDYTNKTKNIRELAYIISKAKFVLCLEGLLNHISASVKTNSFVIFSGFHLKEIANYNLTVTIINTPQVDCAPCWLLSNCPLSIKHCTEDLTVDTVVKTIKNNCNK